VPSNLCLLPTQLRTLSKKKTHAHKTGLTETRRTLIAIILFTQQTTEETREFCREGGEKCNSRTKGEQA